MVSSRIRLDAHDADAHPNRDVWVGWDHGLQSYFAQVFDGVDGDGEDVVTLDAGNRVAQYLYPDELVPLLKEYASIPEDVLQQLTEDREADAASISGLADEAGEVARRALLGDPDAIDLLLGHHPEDDGLDDTTDNDHLGYGSF